MDSQFLVQLIANGLVIGAIYALLAVGLSMIYGIMEVANMAHGEFYMLGAMATYFLVSWLHIDYWAAVVAVLMLSLAMGWLFHLLISASRLTHHFERGILLTLGLGMVLQNGGLYLWTANPRVVETGWSHTNLVLGNISIAWVRVTALAVAVIAFVLLALLLYRTRIGQAMRAAAESKEAALMVGIPLRRVALLTTMVGVALCGLAGTALAPVYTVNPLMGVMFVFKAFAIVVIGGLGSLSGAAVTAVALGLIESIVGGYVSLTATDGIAFTAMIVTLLVRPEGLFGRGLRV
jgi:branched-chain amino acid transport system permease protein